MSTIKFNSNLLAFLFGKSRRAILALLFTHPDESFYLRKILRMTGVAPGAGQRELRSLSNAGIIKRSIQGNQVYYQANPSCPIFPELRSLIIKTAGIGDVLRSSLSPLADRIRLAVIYGSMARGNENKESDIDLLVVGEVSFAEIVERLSSAQDILGREINPAVFSAGEFQKKVREGHHFLRSLINEKLIYVIGDAFKLRELAEKRVDS